MNIIRFQFLSLSVYCAITRRPTNVHWGLWTIGIFRSMPYCRDQLEIYHRRNYLKPNWHDLRSQMAKSISHNSISDVKEKLLWKQREREGRESLFWKLAQNFFPNRQCHICRKNFWAFLILNHVALVLNNVFYGTLLNHERRYWNSVCFDLALSQ